MDDYISRQAAVKVLNEVQSIANGEDVKKGVGLAIQQIKDFPTAMEPVRRGRWYKPKEYPRNSYRFICDNCQDVAYFVTGNNGKNHKEYSPKCGYRYCPNCGAMMEGADE